MSNIIKIIISMAVFGGIFSIMLPKNKTEKPIKLILILIIVCAVMSALLQFSDDSLPKPDNYKFDFSSSVELERTVEQQIEAYAYEYGETCTAKAEIDNNYCLKKITLYDVSNAMLAEKLVKKTGFQNIIIG